jgi:hypothetical protein
MVSESDVRGRYDAYAREVAQLDREMDLLKLRVRMGSEHWYQDLERYAGHAERRRALAAQRQALSWVLALESADAAAMPSAYG